MFTCDIFCARTVINKALFAMQVNATTVFLLCSIAQARRFCLRYS